MGEEVLRAAGQDARRRVLEMPLASVASRVPAVTTLAWLALVFQGLPSLIVIPVLLVLALTGASNVPESLFLLGFATPGEAIFLAACIKVLLPRRVAIGARRDPLPPLLPPALLPLHRDCGGRARGGERPPRAALGQARAPAHRGLVATGRLRRGGAGAPRADSRPRGPAPRPRTTSAPSSRSSSAAGARRTRGARTSGACSASPGYRTGALTAQDLARRDLRRVPPRRAPRRGRRGALRRGAGGGPRPRPRRRHRVRRRRPCAPRSTRPRRGRVDEARLDRLALRVRD